MEEEKNKCQLCEEIKKDRKFPENFGNVLNAGAFVLIAGIIILFLCLMFPSKEIVYEKGTDIKISLVKSNNPTLDSITFNKIVDVKLKEFEDKIEKAEKKRTEDLKYYGTILGFIFSIVGFFGFKSIHDTRQAAIEKAVFDAKKESEIISKKESEKIAEKTAIEKSTEVAISTSKAETEKFLTENKGEIFRLLENPIKETYDPIILEYKERLDKLERPGLYNNEINQFNEKLSANYTEISNRINKLEKELIEKEIELLKLKAKQ